MKYPDGREWTPSDPGQPVTPPKPNKYHAKKTVVDGHVFDSQREANRYVELRRLQEAGEITHLALQVPFLILVNGKKIGKYYADFQYIDKDGNRRVEDCKGVQTPVYKIKKKLVNALYGIEIVEV